MNPDSIILLVIEILLWLEHLALPLVVALALGSRAGSSRRIWPQLAWVGLLMGFLALSFLMSFLYARFSWIVHIVDEAARIDAARQIVEIIEIREGWVRFQLASNAATGAQEDATYAALGPPWPFVGRHIFYAVLGGCWDLLLTVFGFTILRLRRERRR